MGAVVGIHLGVARLVVLSLVVVVGGLSVAGTVESVYIELVNTLFQAGELLVGVVSLVVLLGILLRVVAAPSSAGPAGEHVVVEARVGDEQARHINGVLNSGVLIVLAGQLFLALFDGFVDGLDGGVDLFQCAVGVVVNSNLVGYAGANLLGFVQQVLQLHGSLVNLDLLDVKLTGGQGEELPVDERTAVGCVVRCQDGRRLIGCAVQTHIKRVVVHARVLGRRRKTVGLVAYRCNLPIEVGLVVVVNIHDVAVLNKPPHLPSTLRLNVVGQGIDTVHTGYWVNTHLKAVGAGACLGAIRIALREHQARAVDVEIIYFSIGQVCELCWRWFCPNIVVNSLHCMAAQKQSCT